MQDFLRELRFALRLILRKPVLALIMILSLGLGIGANAAVFSIVSAMLIRPLPFEEAEEVVRLRDVLVKSDGSEQRVNMAVRNYLAISDQSEAFEAVGAQAFNSFDLVGPEEPERINGIAVTANVLPLLGIDPILGRVFSDEEARPGATANVALIGHDLWRRQFNESDEALGQTLTLSQQQYTIIGVLPPHYNFPYDAEIWVPLGLRDDPEDTEHYLHVVARYADEVSREKAQTELDLIAERLQKTYPETNQGWELTIVPIREEVTEDIQAKVLFTLLAASAFLLIIACANAANMLLARSIEQSREMALRTALGASRRAILRQLLVQGLVLAFVSGAVGVLFAYFTIKPVVALSPIADLPLFAETVAIDGRVLGFTFLVSLAVGLLFSLVPALRVSKPNLGSFLREEGRSSSGSQRSRRMLHAFVVAEVAIAVVLLVGAGLMVRNLQKLQQVDVGFDTEQQITMRLSLPEEKYPDDAQRFGYLQRLTERLEALPGVASAKATSTHPLETATWGVAFVIQGQEMADQSEYHVANMRLVMPGYLQAMGTPIQRGRGITEQDTEGAPGVVVISQSAAERYFPDQDPIGQQLKRGRFDTPNPWLTVVGVAGDVEDYGDFDDALYFPLAQHPFPDPFTTLVVRTQGPPRQALNTLRREIWSVDPSQPIFHIYTAEEMLAELHGQQSFSTLLLVIFASLGLTLATIGIYGILSYAVLQRRHEIGVRMALGAQPGNVLSGIVKEGLRLAGIGLVIGGAGALLLTRGLASQLEGVSTADPTTFVAIALIALAVAAAASFLPARRATGIDPVEALRHD